MSAAIAPNPNDPQAPLGMPARPWWIGYIRQLHLDIPLAVESGGTGKNTPLDASDIAETSALKILTATERTKLAGIAEGAEVNAVDSVAGRTGDVTLDADDVAPTTSKLWMSDTQSAKLAGIAENANNYTHPASHPQSMIDGLATALAGKVTNWAYQFHGSGGVITGEPWKIHGLGASGTVSIPLASTVVAGTMIACMVVTGGATGTLTRSGSDQFATPAGLATSYTLSGNGSSIVLVRAGASSWLALGAPDSLINAKAAGALLTEGTPSGPTATGTKGMARFDADYFYVCTATNTWVRFAKDGSWT